MSKQMPLPQYYIVEPTNVCNYRCPICPNRNFLPCEKGYMKWELFVNVINQISSAARVIQLYWMGEPFFHSKLFEMIHYCKVSSNAKIMLSTNGSILTNDVIDSLIKSNVDEIIVSIDASDNQTIYNAIRTGGKIDLVNSNVKNLLSKNNGRIRIILQFIDMFINRSERELFKAKWKQYDCSTSIQCLYTWSGQIPALVLASDNLSPVASKKRVPCADLWNKLCIHWDGRVSSCCFDWHTLMCLGDSSHTKLIDIWNSPTASAIREAHTMGNYNEYSLCSECDAWAEPEEYVSLFHLG